MGPQGAIIHHTKLPWPDMLIYESCRRVERRGCSFIARPEEQHKAINQYVTLYTCSISSVVPNIHTIALSLSSSNTKLPTCA